MIALLYKQYAIMKRSFLDVLKYLKIMAFITIFMMFRLDKTLSKVLSSVDSTDFK